MKRLIIALATMATIAIAGCGGSGGSGSSDSSNNGWTSKNKAAALSACTGNSGASESQCKCVVNYVVAHMSYSEEVSASKSDDPNSLPAFKSAVEQCASS
jgi:hypothetical protein